MKGGGIVVKLIGELWFKMVVDEFLFSLLDWIFLVLFFFGFLIFFFLIGGRVFGVFVDFFLIILFFKFKGNGGVIGVMFGFVKGNLGLLMVILFLYLDCFIFLCGIFIVFGLFVFVSIRFFFMFDFVIDFKLVVLGYSFL